MLHYLIV